MIGKRRRNDGEERDYEDPLKSMEQTIFHLGDQHPTLNLEEDLKVSVNLVLDEYERYGETLNDAIVAWYMAFVVDFFMCVLSALELPHKTSVYVALVGQANMQNNQIGIKFISKVQSLMQQAIAGTSWRHLAQSVEA